MDYEKATVIAEETANMFRKQLDEVLRNGIKLHNELSKVCYDIPIDDLEISPRAKNALSAQGISTVAQLVQLGYHDIKNMKNIGRKTTEDIIVNLYFGGYTYRGKQ